MKEDGKEGSGKRKRRTAVVRTVPELREEDQSNKRASLSGGRDSRVKTSSKERIVVEESKI